MDWGMAIVLVRTASDGAAATGLVSKKKDPVRFSRYKESNE